MSHNDSPAIVSCNNQAGMKQIHAADLVDHQQEESTKANAF